jgi:hypothetical protein
LLEDASQLLKNLGGQEGVKLEVGLDDNTMIKLGVMILIGITLGVVANKFIDIA